MHHENLLYHNYITKSCGSSTRSNGNELTNPHLIEEEIKENELSDG